MAFDDVSEENTDWWALPPGFEHQWKMLVRAFGLVESYPDEPLGNGVLRTPDTISDEQAKVLIDVLKLTSETVPIPPGSYRPRNLPLPSVKVFKMLMNIGERVHPPFGLTIEVKQIINRLVGRKWTQLPISHFLPKEIREAARVAESQELAEIRKGLKTKPLSDLISERLGARPATPRHGPTPT